MARLSSPVVIGTRVRATTAMLGALIFDCAPARAQAEPQTPEVERGRAANPAAAIEPTAANTVLFPRSFFDQYRPSTTIDMINRVPGFTYKSGNGGVRGLAGSGGNVLIDGQLPVTKSLSLDDIIRRIPVSAVLRIDVIRGGAPGIDMQGQTIVANIVRDPRGFASVTVELQTKLYHDRTPARNGRLEGSLSRGDWSASGALVWRDEREQGNAGLGRIVRRNLITGADLGAGWFEADWNRAEAQGNATLEYRSGPDLARINISAKRETERKDDLATLPLSLELVETRERNGEQEASLDYERVLSSRLTGRVMLLKRREAEKQASASSGRGAPQESRDRSREDETIGRLAATFVFDARLTADASAEASYNSLDAGSDLIQNGVPVPVPSDNIRVEERRRNFALSARWQGANWLSVEAGSGYEASTIRQSGDVAQRKALSFWKPRATATIDPAAAWQIRLRAERLVGQLNFGDFAANVSLEPGATSAGNPDLVPERSTVVEAAVERRFWERGAMTLTANRQWLVDAIDLIPIANRFDAPGNIGRGWRRELRAALTLPTDKLDVAGGLIRASGTWRQSRVTDPVTGLHRRISRERPFSGDLSISKDLPTLRSIVGIDLYTGFRERSYRLFEVRTERSTIDPLARLYWDWVPNPRTSFRFQLENFTERKRSRSRLFYQGPRSGGQLSAEETRYARLAPFVMIRMRHQL